MLESKFLIYIISTDVLKKVSVVSPDDPIQAFIEQVHKQTGVDANTTFTLLTTFLIFGLGILVNWFVNILKRRSERRNYVNTVNLLLYNFAEECKKHHELLTASLMRTAVTEGKQFGITLKVLAHVHFLEKIDYSVFIKYYVRGCRRSLKTKAATIVFQTLGSIQELQAGAEKNLEGFYELLQKQQEIYLANLFNAERFERKLLSLSVTDYEVKGRLLGIYQNWHPNSDDTSFKNSYLNLIVPLRQTLDKFPVEPNLDELYEFVDSSYNAFPDINRFDQLVREIFEPFAILNYKAYRRLTIVLKIFGYKSTRK